MRTVLVTTRFRFFTCVHHRVCLIALLMLPAMVWRCSLRRSADSTAPVRSSVETDVSRRTELVLVNVVVRDRKGNVVRGLTTR